MVWHNRRAAGYLVGLVATVLVFTVSYNYGMQLWEGESQPLYHSFEIVLQTFTTTGYGEDAPWSSPEMHFLVVTMQVVGIGLILTGVDVFAVPWLQTALSPAPPTTAPDREDHVVVCEYTPRTEAFVAELESRDREYVHVVPDRETAVDLHEADRPVVYGDPESVSVLGEAGVERASSLVADSSDDKNASIVLAATEVAPEVRCLTLVEDRTLGDYHRIAGADEVYSPRQLVGERLAHQVATAVSALDETATADGSFQVVELPIARDSDLDGSTVADSDGLGATGVHVVGAWFGGELRTPVDPSAVLDEDTTLLVAGCASQLERLERHVATSPRTIDERHVVVAGNGEAGSAAASALDEPDVTVTLLDVEDDGEVDVVGDARDPDVLAEAGIDSATTVIFALGDDTHAVFAALVARDRNPEARIVARVNEEENAAKLHRAGADYVQSLARVSGRMLASTVVEDEETTLAWDSRITFERLPTGDIAGRTIADAAVRDRTGCTVVAVERKGEAVVEFDAQSFLVEADDTLVVSGTDEQIDAFRETFNA